MKSFKTLWNNFPDKSKVESLCKNKQDHTARPFGNYCAILLSECFIKSGINISNYKGNKCWSHPGSKHILLAQDLANGLRLSPPSHFARMIKVDPANFREQLDGKTGVIFFKDYWQRGNESFDNRTGDHIDLWNGSRLTDWRTWARVRFNLVIPGVWSDLRVSKEIWFWGVK